MSCQLSFPNLQKPPPSTSALPYPAGSASGRTAPAPAASGAMSVQQVRSLQKAADGFLWSQPGIIMHQMSSLNKRLGSSIKSARASHQGGTGRGQGGQEENPRALQQWAFLLQSIFQRVQCKVELPGLRASILSGSKPDRFQTQSPLLMVWAAHPHTLT